MFLQGIRFAMMLFDLFDFFDLYVEPRLLEPYLLEPASVVITIGSSGFGSPSSILCVEEMFRFWVSNADGLTNFRFFLMSISLALNMDGVLSVLGGERLIYNVFMYFGVALMFMFLEGEPYDSFLSLKIGLPYTCFVSA